MFFLILSSLGLVLSVFFGVYMIAEGQYVGIGIATLVIGIWVFFIDLISMQGKLFKKDTEGE